VRTRDRATGKLAVDEEEGGDDDDDGGTVSLNFE